MKLEIEQIYKRSESEEDKLNPWGPPVSFYHIIRVGDEETTIGSTEYKSQGCSNMRQGIALRKLKEVLEAAAEHLVPIQGGRYSISIEMVP